MRQLVQIIFSHSFAAHTYFLTNKGVILTWYLPFTPGVVVYLLAFHPVLLHHACCAGACRRALRVPQRLLRLPVANLRLYRYGPGTPEGGMYL